jgi:hypothetical protein
MFKLPSLSVDMRIIAPELEYAFYDEEETLNYVKYQGASSGYTDSSNPYQNTVLSCAVGVNSFSHFFGLGAVNSHAKTTHHGFLPETEHFEPSTPYSDDTWMEYCGADVEPTEDYASRMERGLNTLKMVFFYPSILP